jgi:7,8-dihydropterin-6-yl-methyl-4-(beta-D-ribofuranosyl)aminobenzene 5'-phosphate synthase
MMADSTDRSSAMHPQSLVFAAVLAASALPALAAPVAGDVRLTVIYDAFGKQAGVDKDWGYAALVEVGGTRILFDTGNDAEVFERNAAAKGVDLTRLDFAVMSHRHGDHMGGLAHLLAVNPRVKIYAPKEGFGVYGGNLPSTFYRKDAALPAEQRYFDGAPPATLHFGAAWPKANFELVDKGLQIAPGIHLVSLVSDKTGTLELRELSLVIETRDGNVIVVGCSHPGIDRIVEAANVIDPRTHLVAGGLHLVNADDAAVATTVTALHERFKVAWIAPGHCSGEPAFAALKAAFGDRYLYAGLGTRFEIGTTPHALAASTRAMDAEDLVDYRAALAARNGDDHHEHAGLAVH